MAKLQPSVRARMPNRDFAGPGRSFPIYDRNHAKAALIDVGRSVKAGHITSSEASAIKARAHKFLKTH